MAKNITKLKHRLFPRRLLKFGRENWPPFLLIAFCLVLSFLNYQPGTWLTGWDNLHPEFNFPVNIQRSIFSVWQEYQSLGLLGGHAHASDLLRQLFLSFLNSYLPSSYLRYLWTFLTLTLGPLGVYFLLSRVLLKPKFDPKTVRFASFLGGLFYLLNLATVQYFFTPFETFHAFYAFLPWLIFSTLRYLHHPHLSTFLTSYLLFFISSPAYYTETMFIVLLFALIPILFEYLYPHRLKIKSWLIAGNCLLTAGITQAFWLLPVIFFVLTNGAVGLTAKINLIATPETYYRNLEFANLTDLALLKGFWFNFLDLANSQKFDFLMPVWRSQMDLPLMKILGLLAFLLVLIGIYYSFKKKIHFTKAIFATLLICGFFLLGGGLLISGLPLIGELFRSPFTKLSVLLAFTFSVFFSVGCIFLLDLFSFLHSRLTYILTLFTVTILLVIYMTPAFTGNLISPSMRLKIPQEYFDTFNFFKNQDPATRIANFPQYTFWGWNYYSWPCPAEASCGGGGYRGSGFLWYGIKQPILDRAFDVWDKGSEKYYEEISTAIFNENQKDFEALVDKYAINWILVDKNIIPPSPGIDIGNDKLEKILANSPKFTLAANFIDKLFIYKTNVDKKVKNFMSIKTPSYSPPSQGERCGSLPCEGEGQGGVRPFANLSLRPFIPEITTNTIILRGRTSTRIERSDLFIPSYTDTENLVPTAIAYRKSATGLDLSFLPLLPNILINNQGVYPKDTIPNYVHFELPEANNGLVLNVNDQYYEIQLPQETASSNSFSPLTTAYLPTADNINLSLFSNTPIRQLDLTTPLGLATPYQCYTNKPNRKIEKVLDQNTISLYGTDMVGCLSAKIPPADPNQLLSLQFTYQSHTNTPANANITDSSLGGTASPEPLLPKTQATFTRVFIKPGVGSLQANLILEANEVKTTQEIIYKNISVSYLPQLGEFNFTLNRIPSIQAIAAPKVGEAPPQSGGEGVPEGRGEVTVVIPLPDSQYTVRSNPADNHFAAIPLNCDNFNHDKFDRTISPDGFLYTATNADACDQVNLNNLTHDTNYLITIDAKNLSGLSPTVCLENYSTRRCDVFERLVNGPQAIIQPIANVNEPAGYTLHLFNESFGSRETKNLIRSVAINPFPLNFLKNISIANTPSSSPPLQGERCGSLPCEGEGQGGVSSTHPAEFLYTADISSDGGPKGDSSEVISLFQTRSPYWQAIEVSENDIKLPLWQLILKLPFLYLKTPSLSPPSQGERCGSLPCEGEGQGGVWFNQWLLPPGSHHLIIFYAPQYLEFLGFLLLPLPLIFAILWPKKSPL